MKQTQRPKVLGHMTGLVWDAWGVIGSDEAKISFKLGQSCLAATEVDYICFIFTLVILGNTKIITRND